MRLVPCRLSSRRFSTHVLLAMAMLAATAGTGVLRPAEAAAATLVGSTSSGSSSSRLSMTLNRPSGTVAGHVMVASVVSNDDDTSLTAPAGWALVRQDAIVDALRQAVYVKVATGSEPASYTWTQSGDRRLAGGITTYSGVDTATPVDAQGATVTTTASTAVTAPSVTTTVPDTLLVHLAAVNAEGTLSPPGGMAERWEAASPNPSNARDALASSSDATQAAAGATGTRTATASIAGRNIGVALALRPSGPPPPPDDTPPETTIDSGPSGTVNTSSASFTSSSNEANSTFQCQLDAGGFASRTSPKTYANLANGSHTFAVRATDPAQNTDPTPASRTWTVQVTNDPVLVGAGDISSCSSSGDSATAALLDTIPGTVYTLGDNVYNDGTTAQFNNCYNPTWGRHKARTMPAAGNHDYNTAGATGYFGYFGAAAGNPAKGYYSYDLGAWHIVVLNSNCGPVGGCGAGSAQEQWLRADLAAHPTVCTAAYWHHPRFSSGQNHGNNATYQAFWRALHDNGADVVLAGHDHVYERFAPQTPAGRADPSFGIRQFTVGTGGIGHYSFGTIRANSQVRNSNTFGVLKLTLHANSYDWSFVHEAGKTFTDSGSTSCHGAP